jgi:hypothetical protein
VCRLPKKSPIYFKERMMKLFQRCSIVATVLTCIVASAVNGADVYGAKNPNLGKLRHVVLFKFKDGTTPEQIKSIEDAFRVLSTKVPEVVGYEWGTNVSPENKAQGFTHCFLVTFNDAAGRDAYLPHPAHKEFGKLAGPYFDKVLVIDFVAKD